MATRAAAGSMRTKITVFARSGEAWDADGYPTANMVNVFGEGGFRYCKWVNAYGAEVYEAMRAEVKEPATLTMRYTPKITATCLIYRDGGREPYEVISVNNVENRGQWLEIKVQRKVNAR